MVHDPVLCIHGSCCQQRTIFEYRHPSDSENCLSLNENSLSEKAVWLFLLQLTSYAHGVTVRSPELGIPCCKSKA